LRANAGKRCLKLPGDSGHLLEQRMDLLKLLSHLLGVFQLGVKLRLNLRGSPNLQVKLLANLSELVVYDPEDIGAGQT
jgi:hypothetical protein